MEKSDEYISTIRAFSHEHQDDFKAIWSEADPAKAEALRDVLREKFISGVGNPFGGRGFRASEHYTKLFLVEDTFAQRTAQLYQNFIDGRAADTKEFERKVAAIPREVETRLKGAAGVVFGAALLGGFAYRYIKEHRKTSEVPWTEKIQSEQVLPNNRER
jgi:hypothetical protein